MSGVQEAMNPVLPRTAVPSPAGGSAAATGASDGAVFARTFNETSSARSMDGQGEAGCGTCAEQVSDRCAAPADGVGPGKARSGRSGAPANEGGPPEADPPAQESGASNEAEVGSAGVGLADDGVTPDGAPDATAADLGSSGVVPADAAAAAVLPFGTLPDFRGEAAVGAAVGVDAAMHGGVDDDAAPRACISPAVSVHAWRSQLIESGEKATGDPEPAGSSASTPGSLTEGPELSSEGTQSGDAVSDGKTTTLRTSVGLPSRPVDGTDLGRGDMPVRADGQPAADRVPFGIFRDAATSPEPMGSKATTEPARTAQSGQESPAAVDATDPSVAGGLATKPAGAMPSESNGPAARKRSEWPAATADDAADGLHAIAAGHGNSALSAGETANSDMASVVAAPSRAVPDMVATATAKVETILSSAPGSLLQDVPQRLDQAARISQSGTIEVQLDPEELGRLRMTFTPTENGLHVHLRVDRADTGDLVRQHLGQLAQDLRALGYANVSLNLDSGQSGQSGQSPWTMARDADGATRMATAASDPGLPTALPQSLGRSSGAGGLDLRL